MIFVYVCSIVVYVPRLWLSSVCLMLAWSDGEWSGMKRGLKWRGCSEECGDKNVEQELMRYTFYQVFQNFRNVSLLGIISSYILLSLNSTQLHILYRKYVFGEVITDIY